MISPRSIIQTQIQKYSQYQSVDTRFNGPSKFGLSASSIAKYFGRTMMAQEIADIDEATAFEIYERLFFVSPRLDRLPEGIQAFSLDTAISHGPKRAIQFSQSIANQIGYQPRILEDGIIGPKTRSAVEWAYDQLSSSFLPALIEERKNFYKLIVDFDPSQKKFLKSRLSHLSIFNTST